MTMTMTTTTRTGRQTLSRALEVERSPLEEAIARIVRGFWCPAKPAGLVVDLDAYRRERQARA
jgi:hypothetical protein